MARPRSKGTRSKPGAGRSGRQILFAGIAIVLGLCLIEGICSLVLGTFNLFTEFRRPLAERHHTMYDADLGWVNKTSTFLKDLYGPGRSLTINAQGFRAKTEYAKNVDPGRVRLISSGDSFTLGFGVGDNDTWCARLEAAEPRLEVINMGQGGYGIDQMYLWYERDGRKLDHQIHVFAFITSDFNRMKHDAFLGYGKPTLKLEAGLPVADRIPVKRRSFFVPWLTQNLPLLQQFDTVELLGRLFGASGSGQREAVLTGQECIELALHAIHTMHQRDLAHGSRLVVVWLPVQDDYRNREDDPTRAQFKQVLNGAGIPTIDLVDTMRQLSPEDVEPLFLSHLSDRDLTDYVNASLHYSRRGNTFFAQQLLQHLRSMPDLTALNGEPGRP